MDVLTKEEENELFKREDDEELIEKESSFSWDGRSLIIRFPKEIADFLGIDKENRLEKSINFKVTQKDDVITKTFEIIKRTRPKRKNGNKKNQKKKN